MRCVTDVDIWNLRIHGIRRDNVDYLLVDGEMEQLGGASFWSGRGPDGPMSDENGAAARLSL